MPELVVPDTVPEPVEVVSVPLDVVVPVPVVPLFVPVLFALGACGSHQYAIPHAPVW
jgi:hypothetical protein